MPKPLIPPRGPQAKAAWEAFSGLVSATDLPLLEDLCQALDERLGLWLSVQRGDASPAERANLRVLDSHVEELRDRVQRAADWSLFAKGR